MQFCTNCGRQLANDAAFCDGCGQKLQAAAPTQQAAPQKVETIPPRDYKQEAIIKRRPVLGVLMILAAVAIVVAVILMAMAQY